jgi:hypothetical protein
LRKEYEDIAGLNVLKLIPECVKNDAKLLKHEGVVKRMVVNSVDKSLII